MPDANIVPDPFGDRTRMRSLKPELEALAVEYDRESEPLRCALNAILDVGSGAWAEALYAAGEHLARLDLSDARWGYTGPPVPSCSLAVLARYCLVQMGRASAVRDRDEFERWCARLNGEPAVANEAVASLLQFSMHLVARSRIEARDRCAERVRELLCTAGLELSWSALSDLRSAGCLLSPVAEDAMQHWIDRDAVPSSPLNGRITALGHRDPSLGDAMQETSRAATEREDGNPPAGEQVRRSKKLTSEERQAVEDAVAKYLKDKTAASTEAERRRLAEGITIADVSHALQGSAGSLTGYICKNCAAWIKFNKERAKWALTKPNDMLDRARERERFSKVSRSSQPVKGGSASATRSEDSGIDLLPDADALTPDQVAAYAELQTKYLADSRIPQDRRAAFMEMNSKGQQLVLDGYGEELEERGVQSRSRKKHS